MRSTELDHPCLEPERHMINTPWCWALGSSILSGTYLMIFKEGHHTPRLRSEERF